MPGFPLISRCLRLIKELNAARLSVPSILGFVNVTDSTGERRPLNSSSTDDMSHSISTVVKVVKEGRDRKPLHLKAI